MKNLCNPNNLDVKFKWYEISYDGLIRKPTEFGPEWSRTNLNNYGRGYDSESDAIRDLAEFKDEYGLNYEYVLIKTYS